MPRRRTFRNNFSAGEIGPEYLQRNQDELLNRSLRTGQNVVLLNAGGLKRRPGSTLLTTVAGGLNRLEFLDLSGDTLFIVNFINTACQIYDTDGVLRHAVTGAPWVADDLADMTIINGEDRLYIVSENFAPQVLLFVAGTFTLNPLTFAAGIGGQKRQPYWRFAEQGVTLQPSATTGSVTLTFSDDVLTADHVGTRVRYIFNEIEITSVTNGTTGAGTVISRLYPTISFSVDNGAAFQVGQEVVGDETGVRGQVVSVSGTTLTVTLLQGYTFFANGEKIASGGGFATVTTAPSTTTTAASAVWDEQMISLARGYPRTGALHRNRLILAGFPQAQNAVAASVSGLKEDFDLGDARDSDAFIEALGDDENAEIRHVVSAEQLIILTDRGCYYVPESESAPLSPTQLQFNRISPDGANRTHPILAPEGVVFVDIASRLLVISPTGNVRTSWQIVELSQLGKHILTDPVEITYVDGLGSRSERYLVILNADGTVGCFSYVRGGENGGMTQWTPAEGSSWRTFAAWKTQLYSVQNVGSIQAICENSFDAIFDMETPYESEAAAPSITGATTAYIRRGKHAFRGPYTVGAGLGTAALTGPVITLEAGMAIGVDFAVDVEPAPPVDPFIGREYRRIPRSCVDVIDSGFYRINGDFVAGYAINSNLEAEPPLMNGTSEWFYKLGYDTDETARLEQRVGEGAPLILRSMTLEIAS